MVRVLLNSSSQISTITNECTNRPGPNGRKCLIEILDLSRSPITIKSKEFFRVHFNHFKFQFMFPSAMI